MVWIYLTIAGLLEIVWAFSMKQSDGFMRPAVLALTMVASPGQSASSIAFTLPT